MKVAFVSEFFPPYAMGGAEWSTYYLARNIAKVPEIEVFVFTPNYGSKKDENVDLVRVIRFPFYMKLKSKSKLPSSFYYLNPLWLFWAALSIYQLARKYDVDILHIHGKYSIIPTRLANFFLRKKLLSTIRDYQVICNYGFCLFNNNKSCSLYDYFTFDFSYYVKNYLRSKNIFLLIINLGFAIWGRTTTSLLKLFTKGIKVVVLSKKQKEIFVSNGFSNVEVVGNSIDFSKNISRVKKEDAIVFAGRLTPGKGVKLLIEIMPNISRRYPNYIFYFIGEGLLKRELKSLSNKYTNIRVTGQIGHEKLLNLFSKSKLVVVPSLWPEPFGRTALESLAAKTPVVVSDRGGLPEIVKNTSWGYVVRPDVHALTEGIDKGIKTNQRLTQNIQRDYQMIRNRFEIDITNKYLELYKDIL